MKAIVGLGNPEVRYERTRHNIGFMVVDRMAAKHGFEPATEKHRGLLRKGLLQGAGVGTVALFKPQTYMNHSGEAVAKLAGFFQIEPADILVVHDDMDLPFGSVRFKLGGGPGGHNGLKSIDQELGGREYHRLRMGIGRPDGRMRPTNYVLGRFTEMIERFLVEGLSSAQNRYHNSVFGLEPEIT